MSVPRSLGGLCDIAVLETGIASLSPRPRTEGTVVRENDPDFRMKDMQERAGIESAEMYVAFVPEGSSEWRAGLRAGDRQCRLSHVNAQHRPSQRGDVQGVLAGPAARIEHRSGESAGGCQPHYGWLRLANIPRRRAVVVRRIPGQSRQPFVTGWLPATERIVSERS